MKKLFIVLICILIASSFAACSETQKPARSEAAQSPAPGDAQNGGTKEPAAPDNEETVQSDIAAEQTANAVLNDADDKNVEKEISEKDTASNALVAYFSATGTTKRIAETIAEITGADIYEIIPEQPYTDEDLNYNSDSSRTTAEMNDDSARPLINGEVENWDKYETVYLGYPIWWGEAPRIMDTFVESYDFGGKTVAPFCTSGSSGIGSSARNLEALADGGDWLEGRRFGGGASREEVEEWLSDIGLS